MCIPINSCEILIVCYKLTTNEIYIKQYFSKKLIALS